VPGDGGAGGGALTGRNRTGKGAVYTPVGSSHQEYPMNMLRAAVAAMVAVAGPAASQEVHPLQGLREEAEALAPLVTSDLGRAMLAQVEHLPVIESRTLYIATRPNRALDQAAYEALPEADRTGLRAFEVGPARYYSTFYGTPLVYARLLDLAAGVWGPGASLEGKRILDLGYGQLGQLRLWAQMGADVTGVEVDPILTAMYAENPLAEGAGATGSIRLFECAWPNEEACRGSVGTGYDLFVSRNLLKRGYVKPAQLTPGFPEPVAWGMEDGEAIGHLFGVMKPGGVVIVYSLGPAPDPAKPWSDIANPWPREAWEAAGFEVVMHEADETEAARAMARALGWEAGMDLEKDLFGVCSVYRRPE
jgi:hypothetical protein